MTYKLSKQVRLIDLLVCDQSLSAGACMQNYKSLHVAIMTCATLVNIQTHTDRQLSTRYTSYTKLS